MLVRFGKGSGSSDILGIILWPGPPSNQAFSILVKLTVNAICEGVGFLWRCWFSKAWANTLLYGTLDRHQAGVPSSFPWASSCGSRKVGLRMDGFNPISLTPASHRNTDVMQKGFVLFQDLSTAWETMGWKRCDLRSGTDCMGWAAAPLGGRVLPHAPLTETSKGAAQRQLYFSETSIQCTYGLLCCFAGNISTVFLKPWWVWKTVGEWWDHVSSLFPYNS